MKMLTRNKAGLWPGQKDHLDIPDFLKIPADRRHELWELSPPKPMEFMPNKFNKDEDPDVREFRERYEREKHERRIYNLKKLSADKSGTAPPEVPEFMKSEKTKAKDKKRAAEPIDRTGMRWSTQKNKWVKEFNLKPTVGFKPEKDSTPVSKEEVDEFFAVKPEKAAKPQGLVRAAAAAKATRTPKGGLVSKPCSDKVTSLPEKGKRREVALACAKDWTPLADIAKALDCSEGSVRSHLTDLHAKHGFGYELQDGKARLLTPKGWKP